MTLSPESGITARLAKKVWWQNASLTAWCFSRYCIMPAVIWTGAYTLLICGLWLAASGMSGRTVVGLEQVLIGMGLSCVTLMLTGALVIWGLGLWLLRFAAYARSFLELAVDGAEKLSKQTIQASQQSAIRYVAGRRGYLAKFGGYMTAFLLLPLFVCLLGMSVKALTSPALTRSMIVFTLPQWFDITLCLVTGLLFIFLTENGYVAIVVGAVSGRGPLDAAKQAMALSFRWFGPACVLSLAGLVVDFVVQSPQVLFQLNKPEAILGLDDPRIMLIEGLWQGITSVFVWTFTLAPMCELLRGKVEN